MCYIICDSCGSVRAPVKGSVEVSVFSYGVFFQAEDGIRDLVRSRGLGDVYKRQDYDYWNYNVNFSGIIINVFNPVNGRMWINSTGADFNSYGDPGYINKPFFVFKTQTTLERAALIEFLEQRIPKDHVVIISTLSQYQNSYYPELWESDGPKNIYTVLESLGAQEVRSLRSFNSVPYLMIFRKGRTDFEVKESVGNFTDENEISHSFTIPQTAGSVSYTHLTLPTSDLV